MSAVHNLAVTWAKLPTAGKGAAVAGAGLLGYLVYRGVKGSASSGATSSMDTSMVGAPVAGSGGGSSGGGGTDLSGINAAISTLTNAQTQTASDLKNAIDNQNTAIGNLGQTVASQGQLLQGTTGQLNSEISQLQNQVSSAQQTAQAASNLAGDAQSIAQEAKASITPYIYQASKNISPSVINYSGSTPATPAQVSGMNQWLQTDQTAKTRGAVGTSVNPNVGNAVVSYGGNGSVTVTNREDYYNNNPAALAQVAQATGMTTQQVLTAKAPTMENREIGGNTYTVPVGTRQNWKPGQAY